MGKSEHRRSASTQRLANPTRCELVHLPFSVWPRLPHNFRPIVEHVGRPSDIRMREASARERVKKPNNNTERDTAMLSLKLELNKKAYLTA